MTGYLATSLRSATKGQLACQVGRQPSQIERDRMKLKLLEEARIVCSTLSFSGSSIFLQMAHKFDVVVIDEAAQAVEPAILVPLVQGVKQVYCCLLSLAACCYPLLLSAMYRCLLVLAASAPLPSPAFQRGGLLNIILHTCLMHIFSCVGAC